MKTNMAAKKGSQKLEKESCSSTVRFRNIHKRFKPNDNKRPKGRSGHCMCADDADIYVFGGYSPMDERNGVRQTSVMPELWKFNFATQKWRHLKADNVSTACASSSIAVHNKQVFVFGGTGYPFGRIMSNTIKTLRVNQSPSLQAAGENCGDKGSKNLHWQLLETSAMSYSGGWEEEDITPPAAYGQSLVLHKNSIFIFGGAIGYYSEAVADLHKLSFDTMSWEKLRPTGKIPSGRYKQEVVKDNDRLYILGGGRLNYAENLDKVYIYHIARNHWTEEVTLQDHVHGYPLSRCSFGCVQDGDNVYISGGRHYSQDIEHRSLSDVWHLRLGKLQWTKLAMKLPDPLYFHSAAVSPSGHMLVFGGVHKDGFRAPYLYKIRLPHTMPKLSELCWDKISVIARVHKFMTPAGLASIGVPWNFIDRVH